MNAPVISQPLLSVADVPRASAWYRHLLGAESGHGGDEYERVYVDETLVLQLHSLAVDHHHGPIGDPAKPLGNGVLVWFAIEDFDGAVERSRAAGAEVVMDVHVNPNAGQRELWLRDPDGYGVVVAEAHGSRRVLSSPPVQAEIIAALGVDRDFDADAEIERRVAFLVDQLAGSGLRGFVLGVSGGVDSSTAGRLCQLAVERIRADGGTATFVAMRLPYRVQADEHDAQRALEFIRPDKTLTVDVGPASDAMSEAVEAAGEPAERLASRDLVHGNVKARMRMVAQYAVAGAHAMLVVGTDHAAEAVMGFFTKYGDGAVDVTPLAGLTKRRVRALAQALGAPADIVGKVPTADLESERPGLPDEHVFGVTYDQIDDYLEGWDVPPEVAETIESWYRRTAHKRALPAAP